MRRIGRAGRAVLFAVACVALGAGPSAAQTGDEWRDGYKVGDRVELHIHGDLWQQCVVTENKLPSVMKGRCEEIIEPPPGNYRRAGGIYILGERDTRHAGRVGGSARVASKPPPVRTSGGPVARVLAAPGGGGQAFAIGESVEIEASNHWVPCVVAENSPPSVMRVRCEEYPALSRGAGLYVVDRDNPAAVRKATGQIGKMAAAPPKARQAPGPAGLRVGEYACYGSGGRIMAGLGFKVLAGNRYTDLEHGNAGSFSVSGTTVTFRGGFMSGQSGRNLRGHTFTIAARADCEPF